MGDDQPSRGLIPLFDQPLPPQFDLIRRMKFTRQSPVHHPEGNVWNHTLLVVDEAAKRRSLSKQPQALLWAALLHDTGKPGTTRVRRGRITSYDHDKVGAGLARAFLAGFGVDGELTDRVWGLVRYHMQPLFVGKNLPFAEIEGMKAHADVEEIALLSLCDRLGRLHADPEAEASGVRLFLTRCGR